MWYRIILYHIMLYFSIWQYIIRYHIIWHHVMLYSNHIALWLRLSLYSFLCEFILYIYTGSISSLDLVLTSLWGTACLSENFSLLRWEPNTGQHPAEAKSNARRASDSMLWRSGYSVLCSFAELPTTHCPRAVWRSGRAETASMLILSNKSSHKQVLHVWQYDMCICHSSSKWHEDRQKAGTPKILRDALC